MSAHIRPHYEFSLIACAASSLSSHRRCGQTMSSARLATAKPATERALPPATLLQKTTAHITHQKKRLETTGRFGSTSLPFSPSTPSLSVRPLDSLFPPEADDWPGMSVQQRRWGRREGRPPSRQENGLCIGCATTRGGQWRSRQAGGQQRQTNRRRGISSRAPPQIRRATRNFVCSFHLEVWVYFCELYFLFLCQSGSQFLQISTRNGSFLQSGKLSAKLLSFFFCSFKPSDIRNLTILSFLLSFLCLFLCHSSFLSSFTSLSIFLLLFTYTHVYIDALIHDLIGSKICYTFHVWRQRFSQTFHIATREEEC